MVKSSRLQLSITAKKLTNIAGILQKSDPFAIVTVRGDDKNNPPSVIGHTEVVYNNLSPSWSTVIILDGYNFGVPLYIEVGVFDFQIRKTGKKERDLALESSVANANVAGDVTDTDILIGLRNGKFEHKVMSTALFEVGEVLGSRGNVACKALQTGGVVYVQIERSLQEGLKGRIRFQLQGLDLHNKQTMGRCSSPFFEVYRRVDKPSGATWNNVFRSNVVRSSLNPVWDDVMLELETFCNGDLERTIKICVWDHRRTGKHKSIGEFETSVSRFLEAAGGNINPDKRFTLAGKAQRDCGSIAVIQAQVLGPGQSMMEAEITPSQGHLPPKRIAARQKPEFVDYLTGGCQISLAVAVDFTASNGDPRQKGSPHYFHPESSNRWNDYEKAIFAVGTILAKFDSDQMFPVWGFGAKYDNVVRHCFQCGDEVEVHGVNGILDAYRGVFQTPLTMSFPTDFSEVIRTAALYANHVQSTAQEEGKQSYTILLILTAGNVEKVRETKLELNDASGAPLSVVIVGIGDSDFSRMEFLDEHDPRTDKGRDITKFVRFSDYKSYNALTEAVLDEIPDQLVDYYFSQSIMPGEAEKHELDEVVVQPADDDERTYTYFG